MTCNELLWDIAFIEQVDILDRSVVARQQLHMILLNDCGLFDDSAVLAGDTTRKEPRPLRIGKGITVEFFQLPAQVGDQLCLGAKRQIIVGLPFQQSDKRLLRVRLPTDTLFPCGIRLGNR